MRGYWRISILILADSDGVQPPNRYANGSGYHMKALQAFGSCSPRGAFTS